MAESEEELKSPLMKVKEESEHIGLKLSIQENKIMVSIPITSWEIDGETVSDFIFFGSKIIADGDCSHEIKRRLLLGRKVMTKLDSIFKRGDITLPTKFCLVMAFPVVMYRCESWTVKKAEHRRIDAFELWCWRRLLRVPQIFQSIPGKLFSLHCLEFQAEDRLTPRWHVGQPCGKASWESLVGKPRGKATDALIHAKGSVTLLLQLGRKAHVHASPRDEH